MLLSPCELLKARTWFGITHWWKFKSGILKKEKERLREAANCWMRRLSSTVVVASCRICFHGEDPSDFTACKQSDDIQLQEAFEELPGERYKVYEQGGPLRDTQRQCGFCAYKVWLRSKDVVRGDYLKEREAGGDGTQRNGRHTHAVSPHTDKRYLCVQEIDRQFFVHRREVKPSFEVLRVCHPAGRQTKKKRRLPAWCKVTEKFVPFH